jgi:hypothetical protein
MASPSFQKRSEKWKSSDRLEGFVRQVMVRHPRMFENHYIHERGVGDFLPLMDQTIPGQFNGSGNGVDIFAIDLGRNLWIVEVSRGVKRGATVFKGRGRPVGYAGRELQMSAPWRKAATDRFLEKVPDAVDMLRDLLDLSPEEPEAVVKSAFQAKFAKHRKAIILPEGGHFDEYGTDIEFVHEVYTFRGQRF